MNKITRIDRTDLAKLSWSKLENFYRSNPIMLNVIFYFKEHNLIDKLHAKTSHQVLTISPRNRHDAKVDIIAVNIEDKRNEISYFDYTLNKMDTLSVNAEDILINVKKLVDIIIEKYQLSS